MINLNFQPSAKPMFCKQKYLYRKQEAKTLGFNSYAEYAMESKMAGSIDNVLGMLDTLLQKGKRYFTILHIANH